MKSILYFIPFYFLFFITACNDILDDIEPTNAIPIDQAFESLDDIQTGLTGVYSIFQSRDLGGAFLILVPDLLSDNSRWSGADFSGYSEFVFLPIQTGNFVVRNTWSRSYEAINQINQILSVLETLDDPELTEEVKMEIRGQALFLRGVIYFELVRFFALPYEPGFTVLGVPIMTEPVITLGAVTFPQRATVEDVYERARGDLEEAADLLPDNIARGRANKFTAIGYLAKMAFQKREYGTASGLCDQLFQSDKFELDSSPEEFFQFDGSSKEEIWAVINTGEGFDHLSLFTYINKQTRVDGDVITSGFDLILTDEQKSKISNDSLTVEDLRYTSLIDTDSSLNEIITLKYKDSSSDSPLLRLGEFYLMQAEALVREQGIQQESLDLLNEIRSRSLRLINGNGELVEGRDSLFEYEVKDFQNDPDKLIEVIIRERRVELLYEGNRFHDLMRLRRLIVKATGAYEYNHCNLRLPIPQQEMDANSNLEQNPCY